MSEANSLRFKATCYESLVEIWEELITGSPEYQQNHLDGAIWMAELLRKKLCAEEEIDAKAAD